MSDAAVPIVDAATREKRSVRARRMIQEVDEALQTNTPLQVTTMFPEWQKEFPRLFELLLKPNYDRGILVVMLEQLERVEGSTTSQHNASVAVGSLLVDRIVKPQLRAAGKDV